MINDLTEISENDYKVMPIKITGDTTTLMIGVFKNLITKYIFLFKMALGDKFKKIFPPPPPISYNYGLYLNSVPESYYVPFLYIFIGLRQ